MAPPTAAHDTTGRVIIGTMANGLGSEGEKSKWADGTGGDNYAGCYRRQTNASCQPFTSWKQLFHCNHDRDSNHDGQVHHSQNKLD
jgi:hypothetical protein